MIDGGSEALHEQFMKYLLLRGETTPEQFAEHFHLSSTAAAYWLGRLVTSGKLKIARIEARTPGQPARRDLVRGP